MKRRAILLAVGTVLAALPGVRAESPILLWSDEFNQPDATGPDPAKWAYELGAGDPPGWGNAELETYTSSRANSLVVSDADASDGKALAIRAMRNGSSYTSARIHTLATFQYVRLEARARIPSGMGCWPAFWAVGANAGTVGWPACGEIDVMEWVGKAPDHIKGSLHAPGFYGAHPLNADCALPGGATYGDAYHVFAVDWYPDEIVFSMDGTVYEDRRKGDRPAGSKWPFDHPFRILLNFAVGGRWPGPPDSSTVFPQDYRIDYVRVYALPPTPPPHLAWPPAPPAHPAVSRPAASQARVSWEAPSSMFGAALLGYTLERATDAAFTKDLTTWVLGTTNSFTDNSAQPRTAYFYRVAAVSASGRSDASATVQSLAPVTPGNSGAARD
jgi:beta-glucanase (GH16 family)